MVDGPDVLAVLRAVVDGDGGREAKVRRVAEVIRRAGPYRWVGLYDVDLTEIAIVAWSGEQVPAYPRFPVTQGLGGAAVSAGHTVVVGDVTKDPRYLTTFGSTRSEIVVPVCDPEGRVTGLVDVESESLDAFGEGDRQALEGCARILAPLFDLSADTPNPD